MRELLGRRARANFLEPDAGERRYRSRNEQEQGVIDDRLRLWGGNAGE